MTLLDGPYLQEAAADAFGLRLCSEQAQKLADFGRLVEEAKDSCGLTGLRGDDLWREFLLDPLAAVSFLRSQSPGGPGSLVDVGSGGGTPGIPLALTVPGLRVTLVESHGRKARFLCQARDALGLRNLHVENERVEELARKAAFREQFCYGTAKALAALPVAIELVLPLLRVGGRFLAFKGPALEGELDASERALSQLGGRVVEVCSYRLGGRDYRLAVIEKRWPSPDRFPRRVGVAQRKPLL